MNGQRERCGIVRELACAVHFDRVVETGTYRGTTTEFLVHVFGTPLNTVELEPRYYDYSTRRLAVYPEIAVGQGDSREFLRHLSELPETKNETIFVYLDSHWNEHARTPMERVTLWDEVTIVAAAWRKAVVMIDDFEVPDDPGYAYDDYGFGGPESRLSAGQLPWSELDGWRLFYPAAPSVDETGARRGCCLLASDARADVMVDMRSLREASVPQPAQR